MTTTLKKRAKPPAAPPKPDRRDSNINVRVSSADRDLIDNAASAVGKTRTEFLIESARRQAIDVLLDRHFFALNETDYAAFLEALDNPPAPNRKLKAILAEKPVWEK